MTATGATAVLDRAGLDALVTALVADGRTIVGPTVRDGVVVLAELTSADELPFGWGVEPDAGHDRLTPREDGAAFAHSAGPQSWKAFLYPRREHLWSARRASDGVPVFTEVRPAPRTYALLGVRPCDLRALAGGHYLDHGCRQRRRGALLIAAECTGPGATCCCVSTGGGPAADGDFDLALTEVVDDFGHRFFVRVGSAEGTRLLDGVPHRPADLMTEAVARGAVAAARERMSRSLPPLGLRARMGASLTADRWDDIAARGPSCVNCTMVRPTCLRTTTEEVTDLTADHTERWQRGYFCFDRDVSLLHGGPVRASSRSRCRQWPTRPLSSWHDQFGSGGCVGCGRRITRCPAGIDVTEGDAALVAERDASACDQHTAYDDGSAHHDRGSQP